MIKTENLTYQYPGGQELLFPDVKLERKQHLVVLGESGKGKTTFLHLMAGLMQPKSGAIEIEGLRLDKLSGASLDRLRSKKIGLIFQKSHFIPSVSIAVNLEIAMEFAGQKADKEKISALAQNLSLAHRLHAKPAKLSQGELQRASVIRALVHSPDLVLADEPSASLDDKNCEAMILMMEREAARVGAALLVVTHDKRVKDYFNNQIVL